jgi:hypothetical protein
LDGGSREKVLSPTQQLRISLRDLENTNRDRNRLRQVSRYFANFPNAMTGAEGEIKKEQQRSKDALRSAMEQVLREL